MTDNDSKCLVHRAGLCNFERTFENHEIMIERCAFCHKRVDYKIKDGVFNEAKYRRDHIYDTLQPYGRTGKLFELVYGMNEVNKTKKFNDKRNAAKRSANEYGEEARDMVRTLKRTSVTL